MPLSAENSTLSCLYLDDDELIEEKVVVTEPPLKYELESSGFHDGVEIISMKESSTNTLPLNGFDGYDPPTIAGSKMERFRNMIPANDDLDKAIIKTSVPSMINLAVVPIVTAVNTFWVGRMGIALALAGQTAANQAFFSLYFLVSYLPTITAPLVASAIGSGDIHQASKWVGGSLYLSNLLGGLGTIFLVAFPTVGLSLILSEGAPAMDYARPYLRFRALSMIPALVGATGFAAFRGSLDTITPLKVSLFTK